MELHAAEARRHPELSQVDSEAIARIKKDKPFAVEVMGKYLRTKDKELLDQTYDFAITKYLKARPYPTAEAFRSVIDELAQVNPKAKGQQPRRFSSQPASGARQERFYQRTVSIASPGSSGQIGPLNDRVGSHIGELIFDRLWRSEWCLGCSFDLRVIWVSACWPSSATVRTFAQATALILKVSG